MNPYTIQPGDTLSGIAKKFGVADYNTIAKANNIANPNLIIAGHTLNIPGSSPTAAPAASSPAPVQQSVQSQPVQAQASGDIPINMLPSDLIYNGSLDVSNSVKKQKYDQLNSAYKANNGGGGSMSMPGAPTPFDLIGATNAAYNTPEITAANKAISDANTEYTTKQQAAADAEANINDNPFNSEATRTGKIAKAREKANADLQVVQNKIQQAQVQMASLKADAAIKVNAAQGQYNINRQAYKDTLDQFNTILNAGGLTNATPQDLANYAAQTGISVSVLQSMQKQEQDKNTKTQIIPSTDDAGNVTITAVDKVTGEILSQTVAGQIGKATKQAAGKTAKEVDTNKYLTKATSYLASADIARTGKGTADKKLSKDEAQSAYNQILALVGGNQDLADTVFNQSMNAGGYSKYGNW